MTIKEGTISYIQKDAILYMVLRLRAGLGPAALTEATPFHRANQPAAQARLRRQAAAKAAAKAAAGQQVPAGQAPPAQQAAGQPQPPSMNYQACGLYTMQGTTAEPGMIARFDLPLRAAAGLKFLTVCVLLSRVRKSRDLKSVGLKDNIRQVIEGGPPEELLETFDALFGEKALATKQAAAKAAQELGWKETTA